MMVAIVYNSNDGHYYQSRIEYVDNKCMAMRKQGVLCLMNPGHEPNRTQIQFME